MAFIAYVADDQIQAHVTNHLEQLGLGVPGVEELPNVRTRDAAPPADDAPRQCHERVELLVGQGHAVADCVQDLRWHVLHPCRGGVGADAVGADVLDARRDEHDLPLLRVERPLFQRVGQGEVSLQHGRGLREGRE